MEYLIDMDFEDNMYDALVHFVAIFHIKNESEADKFIKDFTSAFERKGIKTWSLRYCRIDNNKELLDRNREYYKYIKESATASIQIEQFYIENPDQTKTLIENMFEKIDSTAIIGKKYNIPVRALDKKTRNPLTNDIYYFSIEHLITRLK